MLQPINWLNLLKAPAGGFSAEYQAVYDSFTTPPSASVAAAQNTMVESLVDAGVWTKLDVFYLFAQESNGDGEALKNWILPGTNNATIVNDPAFVTLEGFTGANTKYINTNFMPSTDGVNYVQNSASHGAYIRTNVQETSVIIGARGAAGRSHIIARSAADAFLALVNNGSATLSAANTDSRGVFIAQRSGAGAREMFQNKVSKGSDAEASTGVPNQNYFALAYNDQGSPANYSTQQVSMAFAGSDMTQGEIDNLTDGVEAYMDSNGKGVIA